MTETPHIIGISGFMRTGKDSVAQLLVDYFGYQRVCFADALRKVALDINPYISVTAKTDRMVRYELLDEELITDVDGVTPVLYSDLLNTMGYEKAKEVPDFRRYLQRLGTEGIRGNFGEDAWVDIAKRTIQELPTDTKIVMPDVRFPNEAQAVKDLGGVVWRTERPGFDGGPHPSEAMVLKITPDRILRASSLVDDSTSIGLGTYVLQELGIPRVLYNSILEPWAESILGESVSL